MSTTYLDIPAAGEGGIEWECPCGTWVQIPGPPVGMFGSACPNCSYSTVLEVEL